MPSTVRSPSPWVARVGSIGGTEIRVSASCLVVVALLAVVVAPRAEDLVPGLGSWAWLAGAAVGVLVYAAALLHEMAHAAVARRRQHDVPTIVIALGGGRTLVRGETRTPAEEAAIAVAGPVVSLAVGLVALALRLVVDDGVAALVLEALVLANLLIGLLDLVPAPPLDGGRLVRAAAWRALGSRHRGAILAGRIGRGVAVALVLVPVLHQPVTGGPAATSVWLVCVAVAALVWASTGEAPHRWRAGLEEVHVGHLARPVAVVGPAATLDQARRAALDAGADDVVVVDAHRATGLLTVDASTAGDGLVGAAAVPLGPEGALPADVTADQVVSAMIGSHDRRFVVVDEAGTPLGVLDVADVDELRGIG